MSLLTSLKISPPLMMDDKARVYAQERETETERGVPSRVWSHHLLRPVFRGTQVHACVFQADQAGESKYSRHVESSFSREVYYYRTTEQAQPSFMVNVRGISWHF